MHGSIFSQSPEQRARAKEVCKNVISRFAGSERERGFFFTLNQDLFIEGTYPNAEVTSWHRHLWMPGIRPHASWFTGQNLSSKERNQLPNKAEVQKLKAEFWEMNPEHKFAYLKLHGSYSWRSADGSDGMVIGGEKPNRINQEPYLKWSLEIFEGVLKECRGNLLVIGYGFRDHHINKVISDAIIQNQLRLFVVSPLQPRDFLKELREHQQLLNPMKSYFSADNEKPIWEGLHGYYCGTVLDLWDSSRLQLSPMGQALFANLGLE